MEQDCYRILADSTYDWESWLTGDGRVRWVNPAVQRFVGWTVAECLLLHDYPLPIVHVEDRSQVSALLSAGMSGAAGNDVEFRVVHRQGGVLHVAASWQPVEIPGYPRGLRLSIRDISARKSAERALRGSETLYRSIVTGAWEGIWLLDVEGRTEFVNLRMAELLGGTPEELRGTCFQEFLEGPVRSELCSERSRVTLSNRHGESVRVLLSAAPRRSADGGFGGFVLMALEDSTAPSSNHPHSPEISTEFTSGSSAAAGRLADLSRAAAQVAHEINNPLASVRNALRLIREKQLNPAEELEFHRLIDGEIERIGRVVRRMLELGAAGSAAPEVFAATTELQSLARLLEPTANVRGVSLRLDTPPTELQLRLPLDEFRQILFNILTNAIEASPNGSEVLLTARETTAGTAEVQIKDAGPGIPETDLPRLFEPFFSTRSPNDGNHTRVRGLGLAICRSLADRLGLQIICHTSRGNGTTFRLLIPQQCRPSTESL
jgi:PAS domain S-box-containing protein